MANFGDEFYKLHKKFLDEMLEEMTRSLMLPPSMFGSFSTSSSTPPPAPFTYQNLMDAQKKLDEAIYSTSPPYEPIVELRPVGFLSGIKIIEDPNLYEIKWKMYGIADSRRPNNKKPLYMKVKHIYYKMYFIKKSPYGPMIVGHPKRIKKLKERIQNER